MESILDLDAAFIEATESVKDFVNIDASNMLRLYGFYKQATQGECNIPKPSMFSYSALKKYLAWKAVGSISQEEAKSNYIEIVNSLVKASPGTSDNRKVNTQFGVAVSSMLKTEKQLDDCDKTIFDFLKEGNCSRVSLLLQSEPVLLDQMDESEMQLIHWAADRGDHEMIQLLGTYLFNSRILIAYGILN